MEKMYGEFFLTKNLKSFAGEALVVRFRDASAVD
jgi:hypothetical protein